MSSRSRTPHSQTRSASGIAAQGPIAEVMRQRDVLQNAHLRVPWVVEVALALGETDPLPANRDEMIARIRAAELTACR
jgi:hypothetical protein